MKKAMTASSAGSLTSFDVQKRLPPTHKGWKHRACAHIEYRHLLGR